MLIVDDRARRDGAAAMHEIRPASSGRRAGHVRPPTAAFQQHAHIRRAAAIERCCRSHDVSSSDEVGRITARKLRHARAGHAPTCSRRRAWGCSLRLDRWRRPAFEYHDAPRRILGRILASSKFLGRRSRILKMIFTYASRRVSLMF